MIEVFALTAIIMWTTISIPKLKIFMKSAISIVLVGIIFFFLKYKMINQLITLLLYVANICAFMLIQIEVKKKTGKVDLIAIILSGFLTISIFFILIYFQIHHYNVWY